MIRIICNYRVFFTYNVVYGTNINQGVILFCTKDIVFQRFVIYGDKLKEYQNRFLERVEQYYSSIKNKKSY